MPNNVYIGSRYVPIFKGAWDNTIAYEGLSIVTYGGNSYTSKGPVPIGTLPTDTTYWALTGNYNGQISDLQNQIDTINGSISGINSSITGINNSITGINGNITDIDNNLDGISGSGDCVFIGDSFGNDICTQMESNYGFTVTYRGNEGGHGFKDDEFLAQLNTVAGNMSSNQKNAVKYCIAVGGTNDTITTLTNSFPEKIRDFCIRARALFPNARILIGFCSTLYRNGDAARLSYKGYAKYCYMRGLSFAKVNAEFIDGLTEAVADCYWALNSDRVHPTVYGYAMLAELIIQAVRRQQVSMPSPRVFTGKTITRTQDSVNMSTNLLCIKDGHNSPVLRIEAQTFATASVNDSTVYYLVTNTDLPIMPMTAVKQLIHVDSSHTAWLECGPSGLRMFGGNGASLSGAGKLAMIESIEIPLALY